MGLWAQAVLQAQVHVCLKAKSQRLQRELNMQRDACNLLEGELAAFKSELAAVKKESLSCAGPVRCAIGIMRITQASKVARDKVVSENLLEGKLAAVKKEVTQMCRTNALRN